MSRSSRAGTGFSGPDERGPTSGPDSLPGAGAPLDTGAESD